MLLRTLRQTKHFLIRTANMERNQSGSGITVPNDIAAVCQMTATNDKAKNYDIVKSLVEKAKNHNVSMVFFPEGCDYIAKNSEESIALAEDETGPLMTNYRELAKKHDIWLSIGGFHERNIEFSATNKIYNTHFIIDHHGDIKAKYRKVHLFDVNVPLSNLSLQESKSVHSGSVICEPVDTPVGKVGLAICYDLRFPEISTLLRKFGATVLTYPSAFTHATGILHWETLLRARAIENQCYVLAPAQIGAHNEKRTSYGCAMIVDPNGEILGKCTENDGNIHEPEIIYAELSDTRIERLRTNMPVFQHRRPEVYSLSGNMSATENLVIRAFKFSHITIDGNTVFYESAHCFAFTNIRCVVPGHVLVATKRVAQRLTDLKEIEIADLFQTVVKVQRVVESAYNCTSSTVVIQDGKHAGQTVKHVHVHVLPRKQNDFEENDEIYEQLAHHDKPGNQKKRRPDKEMIEEATKLNALINNIK